MNALFFGALYFPLIAVVWQVLLRVYGARFVFTPMHLYSALYLIVIYPGGALLFLEHGAVDYGYLLLLLSGIVLPVLVVASLGLVVSNRRIPSVNLTRKLITASPFLLTSIVLAIFTLIFIQKAFPHAPLLLMVFGDDDVTGAMVATAREDVIQGGGKIFALMNLLPKVLLLLVAMRLLFFILRNREGKWYKLVFSVVVAIGAWTCMLSGSKAIAIFFLLQIGVFYFLIRGRGATSRELWMIGFAVVVANAYLWIWYYAMFRDVSLVLHAWAHRFFITYPQIIYEAYDVFGRSSDLLYGTTFPNPKGILPFQNINFAMLMGEIHSMAGDHQTAERLGLHTVANTASIVEWYANFGMLGSALWGILMGFMMHFLYLWYRKSRRSWVESAIYSVLLLKLGLLAVTYTGSLLDYTVLSILFWYIALNLLKSVIGYCTVSKVLS